MLTFGCFTQGMESGKTMSSEEEIPARIWLFDANGNEIMKDELLL